MAKKECEKCAKAYRLMYRVQYKPIKEWVFLCNDCVIEVRKDNEDYRYGGTWKAKVLLHLLKLRRPFFATLSRQT
jgi:hypothetical protein